MLFLQTCLSLGDSYTIGEQVPLYDNFPSQLIHLLRSNGYAFAAPEIIARTGWTTDELQHAIDHSILLPKYDMVTLLIGVNNQYRGRTAENYAAEFQILLQRAINFAGGDKKNVFVLSIPDWSATPFAEGRDRKRISSEIDQFNQINKEISLKAAVKYIDITPYTREAAVNAALLASDGLHPSGIDYRRWAKDIAVQVS
jgi:lysophospholipase L1-like esterase